MSGKPKDSGNAFKMPKPKKRVPKAPMIAMQKRMNMMMKRIKTK